VDRQRGVDGSTLELYRRLLSLRRELRLGRGSLTWYDAGSDDVVAFTTNAADGRTVLVLANLGPSPVPLPDGARVLVASSSDGLHDGHVPTDTTVWADLGTTG
jgi:alpha-glucosidase